MRFFRNSRPSAASKFEIDKATTLHISELGAAGVHIFFVISGFVMVWTQASHFGAADGLLFLKKRIVRIYPLYWVLAAVNVPIVMMLGYSLPQSGAEWLGSIVLWPSQAASMVEVAWTLGYEMFFYIIFGLLLFLQWNMVNTLRLISALFVGLIVVGQLTSPAPNGSTFVFTNALLAEFAIGAWIARAMILETQPPLWVGWVTTVAGVAGLGLSSQIGYDVLPRVVIWGGPSVLLVFGLVLLERHQRFISFFKRFASLGDASYALYLCHMSALLILTNLLPDRLGMGMIGFLVLSVLYYLLCVVIALAINRFIEKPTLQTIMPKSHLRRTTQ